MKFRSVSCFYENLYVVDENNNGYYIKPQELIEVLNKQNNISTELKKTRTWLHFK